MNNIKYSLKNELITKKEERKIIIKYLIKLEVMWITLCICGYLLHILMD